MLSVGKSYLGVIATELTGDKCRVGSWFCRRRSHVSPCGGPGDMQIFIREEVWARVR